MNNQTASATANAKASATAKARSATSSCYFLYLQVPVELRETYEAAAQKHNDLIEKDTHFNAGFDLFCPTELEIPGHTTAKIDHQTKAAMSFFEEHDPVGESIPVGYYLYPRSSTATKTPLRLANSVGIIDSGYRGNLIAVFDNWQAGDGNGNGNGGNPFKVEKKDRLVQICPPNLTWPMLVILVDALEENTTRGTGGFGSSGR